MLTGNAYAKINLYLDTLSRGEQYTEIRTIFAEIDLHDVLRVERNRSGEVGFGCDDKQLQTEENLVCRVAKYLQDRFEVSWGVDIFLQKNIPVAAGLGGGSSDAAKILTMLNDEWDLDLSFDEQNEIASLFGSDINFFLHGGTCIGTGRGEKISKIDLVVNDKILLINPNVPISSREAYQAVENFEATENFDKFINSADTKFCYNALQAGVERLYPIIKESVNGLLDSGATSAILSGSGATIIGFFDDMSSLSLANNYFKKKNFWTSITKIGRSET